jgi:redox-sensitive bicupin YhaK (pirin superfamily)
MIELRPAGERGYADHGWLKSYHSFSFADYHDPRHMGYGPLRVINEDRVAPGTGFGTHGHRDMEIISYVLEGALAHQDSIGNGSTIVPGDVQRMSAGNGVRHSEYNHDKSGTTHFLQIWIEPSVTGIAPSYEQTHFDAAAKRGRLRLIASPDGAEASVRIHQTHASSRPSGRRGVRGAPPGPGPRACTGARPAQVNGQVLEAATRQAGGPAGDRAEKDNAEVLLFDLN